MYEYFAFLPDGVFNEPVRKPKEFFSIFFRIVMQIYIQVLKVLLSFGVLFWSYVKDMRDSHLEQVFCL